MGSQVLNEILSNYDNQSKLKEIVKLKPAIIEPVKPIEPLAKQEDKPLMRSRKTQVTEPDLGIFTHLHNK